jgi:hypothetical protein
MILGIDPQPTVLGFHLRDAKGDTKDWKALFLKKKSSFKGAQAWQEYVYAICQDTIENYSVDHKISLVVIEQQRGRVNSIIEQSLLISCIAVGLPARTLHPVKWKKLVGLSLKGSNAKNKKESCDKIADQLKSHFMRTGEMLPNRIHDLCDAFYISLAGYHLSQEDMN